MDTHKPLMGLVMPRVMSGMFNKPVKEIRSEEPLSILGANLVELEDDMLTVKSEPIRILPALNNAPKGSALREHSFLRPRPCASLVICIILFIPPM